MLTEDSQTQNGSSDPFALEDILNMDMLLAPPAPSSASSAFSSSGSNRSSHSPVDSFAALPPTPPQDFLPEPMLVGADDPFFSFSALEDFTKFDANPLDLGMALDQAPYDFLSALSSLSSASSGSSPASSGNAVSPQALYSIDPQLVDSPSATHRSDDAGDDEAETDIEDDDASLPDSVLIAPVKAGGKGKARKGTVQSGGITKKTSAVVAPSKSEPNDDLDDWRPSPEEYKKMSSKEKRQLRNKISARNFRVRRKEYITTLEGDIAERDRILDAIRSELGTTKDENAALRQEIASLKKALLNGRGDTPVLPPPAPLSSLSASHKRSASPPLTPNIHKDLPSSPRAAAARPFWGGSMGNFTPVHTALVPDTPLPVFAPRKLQENLNPALNFTHLPSATPTPNQKMQAQAGFDAFADMNPFTLKTLDAYRMQLWTKMAATQQQARNQSKQFSQQPQQPGLTGLASSLRPSYFQAAKPVSSQIPAGVLSGKSLASSPSFSSVPVAGPSKEQQVAAIASQTLLGRLGSAFWDAFSGHGSEGVAGPSGSRSVDAEKVRRVLEGKAVLQVVDVEPRKPTMRSAPTSPRLVPVPNSPKMAPVKQESCGSSVTALLEESMRSLTISKKSPPV